MLSRIIAETFRLFTALVMAATAPSFPIFAQQDTEHHGNFDEDVRPLLRDYCLECHGEQEQSGERRFDLLRGTIHDQDNLVDYQDVLDQLNLGEMPPEEAPQPANSQRLQAIRWLTRAIGEFHANARQQTAQETVLRRLNAREYRNVVRDLFSLNMSMFDPTIGFPRDQQKHHLDNLGSELVTSSHLLTGYLNAADQIVDKAIYPLQRPEVQTWNFRDGFRQQPEIDQVHRHSNHYEHLTLYDVIGADKHEGAYAPILAFADGVPHDGYYKIRFRAAAINREHPYEDKFLGMDRREPFRLGIVAGNREAGELHKPQPVEPLLAELELSDEMREYEVSVWLDQGFTPRFTFQNGLMDARSLWTRIQREYPKLFPQKGQGIVFYRRNAIVNGKIPQIHIDDIEISGPHFDQWPRSSQRICLGQLWEAASEGTPEVEDSEVQEQLQRFMTLAYRREPTDLELANILKLVAQQRAVGRPWLEAYAAGLKAILCSPNFLYWEARQEGTLSSSAFASRLSSFLWSSMPDSQLQQIDWSSATPDRVHRQVTRMLADEKSDAFVQGFLDSWLTLSDLGATPPDRRDFADYYQYDLKSAMLEESRLFFRHLLTHNLPVRHFVDADYTFVNKRLAMHYDLEVPPSLVRDPSRFAKVPLDDRRRGGVLGQASVLTVTANGIDTSPVVRGVWLLENILGTPPSPPPPDVPPLDPDVRGAKSIREQLEKHRTNASCNECHRRIDPMGFALENFDPLGRWRTSYGRGVKVDSSGALPNGSQFDDVVGLKDILLEKEDLLVRALAGKLLAYAIGREITPMDRPDIDWICRELEKRGGGLQDLVELVVLSRPFAQ